MDCTLDQLGSTWLVIFGHGLKVKDRNMGPSRRCNILKVISLEFSIKKTLDLDLQQIPLPAVAAGLIDMNLYELISCVILW